MRKTIAFLILILSFQIHAEDGEISFGVASVDITPREPIRLNGFSKRIQPSNGVIDPLYARALAIRDNQQRTALIITLDLLTIDKYIADRISDYVKKRYRIPRERIMINASHTHTGPVIFNSASDISPLNEEETEVARKYTELLETKIYGIVDKAMASLVPGLLKYGVGSAEFASNRREYSTTGLKFGLNPFGPVDSDVPVLAIYSKSNGLSAVVFGYACHPVTYGGSLNISADYPGFARKYIEMVYPEVMTFFIQGCAGEINPSPKNNSKWAKSHGMELAGAVLSVVSKEMLTISPELNCNFQEIALEVEHIPTKSELDSTIENTPDEIGRSAQIIRQAKKFRRMIENGEDIPKEYQYPIQVWKFGKDFTWIALGSEVTVDYSIRLKHEITGNCWVSAYTNDVRGYVSSVRLLLEGGYESDLAIVYYGLPYRWKLDTEEKIISTVHQLRNELK